MLCENKVPTSKRYAQPTAKAAYSQTSSVSGNQQHDPRSHLRIAGCCRAEHGCVDLTSTTKDPILELQRLDPESFKMDRPKQQPKVASEAALPCRGLIKLAGKAHGYLLARLACNKLKIWPSSGRATRVLRPAGVMLLCRETFSHRSQWHPLFFSVMVLYCQVFVEVMHN